MFLRLALGVAVAAATVAVAQPQLTWAQSSAQSSTPTAPQTPPAAGTKPDTAPPTSPEGDTTAPAEVFGEEITLVAKPIVFLKGTGNWDNALETVTNAFKTVKAYVDSQGLKPDGSDMTIYTATDDTGFQFEAAIPVTETPKNPPPGNISVGMSPQGRAIKFVHHGSYDALENTYEAITNYLDEKKLQPKDMFIEQYVTDPLSTKEDNLTVNVLILIK